MPMGNVSYGNESIKQTVQECKECTDYPEKKRRLSNKRNFVKSNIGKIPFEFLKMRCPLPMVGYFIIVTTVTTTKKDNEKRRKARICFGIPFPWKIITSAAVTAVNAFCFSHCPKSRIKGGASLCSGITRNPKTRHS